MTTPVDLSSIDISFDQTDIERAMTRPKLEAGWYQLEVRDAKPYVNPNSGNMSIKMTVHALDGSGNPKRPSVSNFLTIPRKTPPALLEAVGIDPSDFLQKVPDTIGLVQSYLRATRPDDFPTFPKYQKSEGLWSYGDQMLDKEETAAVRKDLLENIFTFLTSAWSNPHDTLSGDRFFAEVAYREGSDWPNVNRVSLDAPADVDVIE